MNYSEKLFRCRFGFAKGDDPETNTQSDASTNQTDNRVGASENGVAVGSGGWLDQSFTDNSRTELTTIDASDRSFTDNSKTILNTTDARDLSTHVTDSRSFVDNSVHNDLSADVAAAALRTGAESLAVAGGVLEKQLDANERSYETTAGLVKSTNNAALSLVADTVEKSLDNAAEQTAALAAQQTGFLKDFYTEREGSDVKVIDGLAKYAAGTLIVGAIAWALKS